ncbi:MAG: antitoxin Xre/MbcA/ParS toxin-binding domain-containing protein [Nitrospiria bacterium]
MRPVRAITTQKSGKAPIGTLVSLSRTALALSQERFAGVIGVSVRTVVRWEQGDEPADLERERLEWIRDLVDLAQSIMENDQVSAWFATPKIALDGRRPLDFFGTFRGLQQVRGLLEATRWGTF